MKKKISDLIKVVDSYAEDIIKDALGTITIPVDIEKIIKYYGIAIYKDEMPFGESGAIVIKEDSCGILINKDDHHNRQKFTMAHELGHFISYRYQERIGDRIDKRNLESTTGSDIEEIFANKFAAAILMPVSAIKPVINSDPVALASTFSVSVAAIQFRIKNVSK